MKSGDLTRWITAGANVAVLVGIGLVLLELNQNADLMRAQMIQARIDQTTSKYDAMVHSDYWPAICSKRRASSSGKEWIESLTPDEFERVQYYYFREYEDVRGQYFQYQDGYVSEEYWESVIKEQIHRLIELAVALEVSWSREMQADPFRSAIIEVSRQSSRGKLNSENTWEPN